MTIGTDDPLGAAAHAVSRGDWQAALDTLDAAGAPAATSAVGLELRARAAYGAGRLEASLSAWEELHGLHAGDGADVEAAAAAATIAMHLLMDTGLMASVRGWVARAERFLVDHPDTPVHALLAMVHGYERFLCGDMEPAALWSRRAVASGTAHDVPAAVVMARTCAARVRILDGRVDEGLRDLDEIAVMLLTDELDPLTAGMVWCELICAAQGLARHDLAEEWTQAMQRWGRDAAIGGINGRCRVHRAEMLRLRGSCEEAEDEALHACEELRPWMRREFGWPLTELGTIRLRRGDLAGAEEAFRAAHDHAWEPQPGLALVRLAQGDVAGARALVRGALEHPTRVPSKERPPFGALRRAPLLDAHVPIALADGDVAAARLASEELAAIAAEFGSPALAAMAALAEGRVALAEADTAAAVRACERAVAGWTEVGAPFEAAVARTVLAPAHEQAGNRPAAQLAWEAARAAFDRVGARRLATEAAAACAGPGGDAAPAGGQEPGARAGPGATAPDAAVFRLDGDTRRVTFGGTTVLLQDLKGLRYLERLLAEPGREFHVLDLVAVERGALPTGAEPPRGSAVSDGGDAGLLLDDQARAAYRRRLVEIEQDIDDATRMHDPARVELACRDRDYLVRELSRAVGLGGRARVAGSTSERARTSVTRTVRYALQRVTEHHAALAAHLEHSIHTGTYCAYHPDPAAPVVWEV